MGLITSDMVSRAKAIRFTSYFDKVVIPEMGSYYNDYAVDLEARPFVKCPIHIEDTPSLKYYEETNTVYCFGCGVGGDIITFHRKFMESQLGKEITYDEAINFLLNTFSEDGIAEYVSEASKLKEVDFLSDKTELLMFTGYTKSLEGSLLKEKSLNVKSKTIIWRALDEMVELVALNKINANEAKSYIKGTVTEQLRASTIGGRT